MREFLSQMEAQLPCRSSQISQLYNLYAHKGERFPDSLYIQGSPSTGKSIVVSTVLDQLDVRTATVNLVECYTARILFESILNQLLDSELKCDNMMDFVDNLRRYRTEIKRSVLIIDKAERFRTMDFNLFPGFLKLRELTGGVEISVIFLSQIIIQKFYAKSFIVEPLQMVFPQYNKEELLRILCLDLENAQLALKKNDNLEFDLNFYRNYLNVLLSVFYRNCRDLSELRYVARKNFPIYCRPIINGENTLEDSVALWRKVSPHFKHYLQNLYLRVSLPANGFNKPNMVQNLELPFYAKYLLIAAYLASYNPAKDDKRLFMKYHGKTRKTLKDVKKKSKVAEQLNTLLGPKPFTLDRLLAIFYSVVEHKVSFNSSLLVQVSSLVELQLLSALSDSSNLNGAKYKCNVNFDLIQMIAKMVGFNIRKYLSDFSHM